MSAASQAKRRSPDAQVIVLERGPHVSYGACGMPYNLEDPERSMEDLVVMTPERFREERGLDVRVGHEVQRIYPQAKTVVVHDDATGLTEELRYDKLVIATGARAIRPPLPGLDLPGVFLMRQLTDGAALKRFVAETKPKRAVVIGAGYIGMEMCEAFRVRGLEVTLLELAGQVVPGFQPEIATLVAKELERNGVVVRTGQRVTAVETRDGAASPLAVRTEEEVFAADVVLVSVGVRPNVDLAVHAGVALGETGAIAVDAFMRTNVPDLLAAGDCVEARHVVTDRPVWVPLGTTANKTGKIAGANAAGEELRFPGIAGTAVFKVFGLEVARTGITPEDAARGGIAAVTASSQQSSRGHGYPGAKKLTTLLTAERGTGRLLGAQMVGAEGVATRIDVFATALSAKMTLEDVEGLDLAYAPPFAPVYDPILIAATVARKRVEMAK